MLHRTLRWGAVLVALGCFSPLAANAASTYGAAAPSAIVAPQVTQQAATQTTSLLAGRISQAVSNVTGSIGGGPQPSFSPSPGRVSGLNQQGKAAGDPVKDTALWMNAGNAWVENDQDGVNFDGTIQTAIVGIDHQITDNWLVGVAAGYEHPDVTTKFNNGTFKGNNFALFPYAAYIINKNFSLNAVAGYTLVNYDTTRNNGAVTGSIEGDRLFGNLNATASTTINNWGLSSTAGYMWLLETQDAYTETGVGANRNEENQVRLGQLRWTNKAGYTLEQDWGSITPYGSVRLEYDASHTPTGVADAIGTPVANDRFGATFGIGADAKVGDDISVSLEGTSSEFREHLSTYAVSGTVRIKF